MTNIMHIISYIGFRQVIQAHIAYITNLSYCNTMGPYYLCKAEIKNMTTIHVLSHEHLTPDMTLL